MGEGLTYTWNRALETMPRTKQGHGEGFNEIFSMKKFYL